MPFQKYEADLEPICSHLPPSAVHSQPAGRVTKRLGKRADGDDGDVYRGEIDRAGVNAPLDPEAVEVDFKIPFDGVKSGPVATWDDVKGL